MASISRRAAKAIFKKAKTLGPKEKPPKPPRISPNVFVAFRVRNEKIVGLVKEIQESLLTSNAKFGPSLTVNSALHITFMVAKMEKNQLDAAKKAMQEAVETFNAVPGRNSLTTRFHGVSSFSKRVLFGCVHPESLTELQLLEKALTASFTANNVLPLGTRPLFIPHLTIARFPRNADAAMVDVFMAQEAPDREFDVEEITEILLCQMHMNKRKDEFYRILHSERLFQTPTPSTASRSF